MSTSPPIASAATKDYAAIATRYAEDVLANRVEIGGIITPQCKWVKLACERHLRDLERADKAANDSRAGVEHFPFVLDPQRAARVCRFLEALPHVKDEWGARHELLVLERWETFIIVGLFGWVERADPTRYRFRKGYIGVPRKNGKSLFGTAGIGLYKFCADGVYGAEVYVGATSEDQAKRVGFRPAWMIAKRTPKLCEAFGITVQTEKHPVSLTILKNGSIFKPVIANPGDGDSPSCAIMEEYHEHKNDTLNDAMEQGMGSRKNPLMLYPTTAGFDRSSPCFALEQEVKQILERKVENERFFAVIYTVDEDDDWTSELALRKANPNFGVSIDAGDLRQKQIEAQQSSRKQNTFKVKRLNIWPGVPDGWMNMLAWEAAADRALKLEQFAGEECWDGLDLADSIDLAANVRCFRRQIGEKKHFYLFATHWLNEEHIRGVEHYERWVVEGRLIKTPGNVTDYPAIKRELIEDGKRFALREVPHDPHHAGPLVQFIQQDPEWNQQAECIAIQPTFMNFTPAMNEFEAAVLDGRVHHDGDPLLAWCISNIVCQFGGKGDIYPKRVHPDKKIDGGIAALMAFARANHGAAPNRSVYEDRGVISI